MTSEEFYGKARKFLKVNPDLAFIIEANPLDAADKARQSESRDAWLAYLEARGLRNTAQTWRMILAGAGKAITVPTEKPEYFDATYVPGSASRARQWEPA